VPAKHYSKGGVKGTSPVSVFGAVADSTDERLARGRRLVVALGAGAGGTLSSSSRARQSRVQARASQAGSMAGMGDPTYPTHLSI